MPLTAWLKNDQLRPITAMRSATRTSEPMMARPDHGSDAHPGQTQPRKLA